MPVYLGLFIRYLFQLSLQTVRRRGGRGGARMRGVRMRGVRSGEERDEEEGEEEGEW